MRVLLVNLPPLLRDIMEAILSSQPDMTILADAATVDELGGIVRSGGVEVVMTALFDEDLPGAYRSLVSIIPGVKLIGIALTGRRFVFYELRTCRTEFTELDSEGLVGLIRATGDR